jgi:putative acetyltransferase
MNMSEEVIRTLRPEDAPAWHELRTQPQVVWGTLQLPTLSVDDVRSQLAANPDVHRLGAEVDGRLAGTVDLWVGSGMERHAGSLGISVHDAFQGRGLGRRLMAAILDVADNSLLLDRIDLDVYVDNERAISLYTQLGFEAEGMSRCGAMRDGALVDFLHMGRLSARAHTAAANEGAPAFMKGAPLKELTVRGARPEDLRAILRLYREPALGAALGRLPTFHDDEIRKEYCVPPRGHHVFVAELSGDVIGLIHLAQAGGRRAHVGSIQALAVSPEWQGRGAGTALLQAAINLGERWLGLKRMQVRVQACEQGALHLFHKFGFASEVTQRAAFIRNGRFMDAHLLGRVI